MIACTDTNASAGVQVYSRYALIPVKQHNDYYTISDVIAHGAALGAEPISMMLVVKQVNKGRRTGDKD